MYVVVHALRNNVHDSYIAAVHYGPDLAHWTNAMHGRCKTIFISAPLTETTSSTEDRRGHMMWTMRSKAHYTPGPGQRRNTLLQSESALLCCLRNHRQSTGTTL